MGLGLDITPRHKGAIDFEVVRPIVESDLVRLSMEEKLVKPNPIKRLSSRHHALARCIAGGMSSGEAAISCGYLTSSVSILLSDPTFAELVAKYRANIEAKFLGVQEKIAGLAEDAFDILQDRVNSDPDKIDTRDLMEIAKLAADRSGNGPQRNTTVNVNIGLADRLEAARRRMSEAIASRVIDGEIVQAAE